MGKYKLKITKTYSPIIGIMGKGHKHHTDYMPLLNESIMPVGKSNKKINSSGHGRVLIPKKIFRTGKGRREEYEHKY